MWHAGQSSSALFAAALGADLESGIKCVSFATGLWNHHRACGLTPHLHDSFVSCACSSRDSNARPDEGVMV